MSNKNVKPNNHHLFMMVLIAVVLLATVYFVVKQSQHLLKMQVALQEVHQTVQEVANKPQAPTLFTDAESFNTAVINAFEGYVAQQQLEAVKAKEANYTGAELQTPKDKHIYGDLNARFTLVEFSDLECPYCKRFHNTPKRIVDGSNGMVNWQWKHLPLGFHNPAAQVQAQAAECVAEVGGNRKFWMFLDAIFEESRGNGQGVPSLTATVQSVGVDETKFAECMQSGHHQATVEDHVNQATKFGINGTPATFVVDNQTGKSQLLSGAQPEQAFLSAISKLAQESDVESNAPVQTEQ